MPEQYSIEEFGQKIKERYPEYQNIDNKQLGQKMLEKYPEYSDRVNLQPSSQTKSSPSTNYSSNSSSSSTKSDGFLKSMVKNIAKPFSEVGTSIYNVGSSIKSLASGDVQGAAQELDKTRNIPFLGETKPAFTSSDVSTGYLPPVKKMTGYGAEIASTIAPVGKIGTGGKALLQGAGKFGLMSGVGELGSQLENNQEINPGKILESAVIGSAIPVVGRGASKVIKGLGNVSAELLGKTTGTSADVIKEAFNNPNVIKFARQAGTKGSAGLQQQALEEAEKGLKQIVQKRGNEYVANLERIKISGQEVQQILDNTRNGAKQLLSDFDIKLQEGKKLNNLNFDNSTITKNKEIVQKAFNDVMSWRDTSAAGMDRLKKRLTQYANDIPATERGGAHNFVMDLKDSVDKGLKESVPGYREMTTKYAESSQLIGDIEKALSLKDNASKDTAIRKLMSTVRDNNDLRKEFVDVLSGVSGSDIRGKLAGSALSPGLASGLAGKLATGSLVGGGAATLLSPSIVPLLISYFASSSPRLVGEVTSLLGRVTKPMIRANKFSPQIQNSLRVLLQRSLSEDNSSL